MTCYVHDLSAVCEGVRDLLYVRVCVIYMRHLMDTSGV